MCTSRGRIPSKGSSRGQTAQESSWAQGEPRGSQGGWGRGWPGRGQVRQGSFQSHPSHCRSPDHAEQRSNEIRFVLQKVTLVAVVRTGWRKGWRAPGDASGGSDD